MPIPKYDFPKRPMTEDRKAGIIVSTLCCNYGYDYSIKDARDAVSAIERDHIDTSGFDFPYGSFEEFKKHTLTGEFDINIDKIIKENEQKCQQAQKDYEEGRTWIMNTPFKKQPFFQNRRNINSYHNKYSTNA